MGLIILVIVSLLLFAGSPAGAVNFVCGQDLNGDGAITGSTETGQCIGTPEGQLCPVGAVRCLATYTPGNCPAWGGLNGSTDQCEGQSTGSGSGGICVDDLLYIRAYQETPTRYHLQLLDTGPRGDPHRNCGGGGSGGGIDDWHTIRIVDLPAPAASFNFSVNAAGSGCGPTGATSVNAPNQSTVVLSCSARGRQTPSYNYSFAFTMSAVPTCSTGTYDADQNGCYQGDSTCPLGSQFGCMNRNGTFQCSPNQCVDLDATPPTSTNPDLTSYQNDGQVDPGSGMCLGETFIFNGKPGECRPPGATTSFFNCCSNGGGDFLVFQKYCSENEWQTNAMRDADSCHFVGDYCKTRWPLIGCVQKAEVYCCFNSRLARAIQEQGRGQLINFAPDGKWGDVSAPNCVGLSPAELQYLDFSRIDLPIDGINPRSDIAVQQEIGNKINDFYQSLQP